MQKCFGILFFSVLVCCSNFSFGDVADFEDVAPLNIPSTPFSSGGLDFNSTQTENAVFPSGFAASDNGTQTFGWCGSACNGTQLITATTSSGELFNVFSVDAGHLTPAGQMLGYVPGMTVEVVGHRSNGTTVEQSLFIVENQVASYDLTGFTRLTSIEFFAPEVLAEGQSGMPDPLIDNIVFAVVPEPMTSSLLVGLSMVIAQVRRRKIA